MDTHGGFLLDARAIDESDAADKRAAKASNDAGAPSSAALEMRKLTPKQEVRLMSYLDDAFQQLNRGFTKRYTSATSSSVPTLTAYLERTQSILAIIASIPPIGGAAQLLVNYLLRYTSELTDGIPGYDLSSEHSEDQSDTDRVTVDLERAVQALDMLDRTWAATLRGKAIDWKLAEQYSREEASAVDDALAFPPRSRTVAAAAAQQTATHTGRYPASTATDRDGAFDTRAVVGTRGYATVSQTQRIRLRNVIILAKENLFAWMRTQLDAPLPPPIDGSERDAHAERRELMLAEGDLEDASAPAAVGEDNDASGNDEVVLEDVDTSAPVQASSRDQEHDGPEQKHYDALFAKAVDPDASDSEEDDKDEKRSTRKHNRSSGSVEEEEAHTAKRQVRDVTDHDSFEPTEAESEATLNGITGPVASAVMRWDVAFARLFSRTLRCLSDIQDHYGTKERRANETSGSAGMVDRATADEEAD